MKSPLYTFFTPYALDKNPNFKHEIRNSRCLKSDKNNEKSEKEYDHPSHKPSLFHKLFLLFIHHPPFYKHSNFKNEIRNSRCSKPGKKNENQKSENDYVLLNIFVTISHKKNSLFDEKSFFDKFIFNSFNTHQKSIDI